MLSFAIFTHFHRALCCQCDCNAARSTSMLSCSDRSGSSADFFFRSLGTDDRVGVGAQIIARAMQRMRIFFARPWRILFFVADTNLTARPWRNLCAHRRTNKRRIRVACAQESHRMCTRLDIHARMHVYTFRCTCVDVRIHACMHVLFVKPKYTCTNICRSETYVQANVLSTY